MEANLIWTDEKTLCLENCHPRQNVSVEAFGIITFCLALAFPMDILPLGFQAFAAGSS